LNDASGDRANLGKEKGGEEGQETERDVGDEAVEDVEYDEFDKNDDTKSSKSKGCTKEDDEKTQEILNAEAKLDCSEIIEIAELSENTNLTKV